MSQTPTPERSPAPAEILNLPASVLAPVPARSGEPVCLFGAAQPDAGHWELYGPDQQRLARLDFHSGERPCMDTRGMAPGVYYVAMHLDFAEASQDRTQAIVLLP